MSDEQIGFGPAALENPETDNFATKHESLTEVPPSIPEAEPGKVETSGKYEKILQSVGTVAAATGVTDEEAKKDVTDIHALETEEQKVAELVKLAQTKGLPHAVKVAERLKDYYALDVFHDTLADNLYDSLLQQGLITKE